jgi:tetratricopeptide (TPR) repeat protein
VSLAPVDEDQNSLAAAALSLAKLAVEQSPEQRQFYLNTLGAAYLRNGQYDEAIGWLNEARRIDWINDSLTQRLDRSMKESVPESAGTHWDWLLLAMACQKRDDPQQAQTWLAQVHEWVAKTGIDQLSPWLGWENDLELEILLDEAEQLIEPGDESP